MNINSTNNNYNVPMYGIKKQNWFKKQYRRLEQMFLDVVPCHTTKDNINSYKKWDKVTNLCSNPMWNRGIMGATAITTQPIIDYYNHRVDDETRIVSANRTLAKIIAGTAVGMFVVRGPIYKMVEKLTNPTSEKKLNKILIPQKYIEKLKTHKHHLDNYRSALAMILALGAMCITNFMLDAPLTTFLTNLFNKKAGITGKKSVSSDASQNDKESEVKNV